MSSQLSVYGRVDLDGTHKAIIESDLSVVKALSQDIDSGIRLVKISSGKKTCGCILSEFKSNNNNRIYLDRYKQWHLGVRDGDKIEIEALEGKIAQSIVLRVPRDYTIKDTARFMHKPLASGEKTALFTFSGEPRMFSVGETKPAGIVVIDASTRLSISGLEAEKPPISYKDIGGLGREVKLIRELVEYPLRFPEVFGYLGVSPPRGIILYGPPGTGKTLLARAVANETGAKYYSISGPELYSMWYGKTEEGLRNIFKEAAEHAPSIVLIDELDALLPRREKSHGDLEQRITATFLTQMDGLKEMKGVVVLGTTNRINSIDTALRRGGRFEHEIHVGVPDFAGRIEILRILTRGMPLNEDVSIEGIAEKTVGFVGADIAALCREAAYNALRGALPAELIGEIKDIQHKNIRVGKAEFENALQSISPSAIKEFAVEIPKVNWDDIGGLEEIKRLLNENIAYAISKRDVFEKIGVKPARGILLFGLPGTGKTLLAKAVATQCGANFIAVKGPELFSKWFGESEERVRFIFARAREVAPCVVCFDEIDAAVPIRGGHGSNFYDPIVNQMLSEMDGLESSEGVYIIGTTNRSELIDPAFLRPGRFDYQLEVPLPDKTARMAIWKIHLKGKPQAADIAMDELVNLSNAFSGAEIAEACREAIWDAIREGGYDLARISLTQEHLTKSIAAIRKNKDMLKPKPIGFHPSVAE